LPMFLVKPAAHRFRISSNAIVMPVREFRSHAEH
jgi:hypothetical protein